MYGTKRWCAVPWLLESRTTRSQHPTADSERIEQFRLSGVAAAIALPLDCSRLRLQRGARVRTLARNGCALPNPDRPTRWGLAAGRGCPRSCGPPCSLCCAQSVPPSNRAATGARESRASPMGCITTIEGRPEASLRTQKVARTGPEDNRRSVNFDAPLPHRTCRGREFAVREVQNFTRSSVLLRSHQNCPLAASKRRNRGSS